MGQSRDVPVQHVFLEGGRSGTMSFPSPVKPYGGEGGRDMSRDTCRDGKKINVVFGHGDGTGTRPRSHPHPMGRSNLALASGPRDISVRLSILIFRARRFDAALNHGRL
jgi:hypothetical protein